MVQGIRYRNTRLPVKDIWTTKVQEVYTLKTMKLGSWIKTARLGSSLTQEDLALELGLTKGNISAWENNRHNPSFAQIKEIVRITGIHFPMDMTKWVDEPPAIAHLQGDLQGDNYSQGPEMQRTVPLISWVQAGPFTLAEDPEDVSACPRIETTVRAGRRSFALRVENDSMSPVFPPGTILIVDPDEEALSGRYVIVGNGSGEATFKQLVRDGEDWLLRPLNPQFPVKPMPAHYRVIGVVVASERKHI